MDLLEYIVQLDARLRLDSTCTYGACYHHLHHYSHGELSTHAHSTHTTHLCGVLHSPLYTHGGGIMAV